MARAYGTEVTLRCRWMGAGDAPGVGVFLETRAGSLYEVMELRPIGGDPNHLRLSCLRTDPQTPRDGRIVYDFEWDKRPRKKAR